MVEYYSKPLELALKFHRENQLDKARQIYIRYLKQHPNCPDGLYLLSILAYQSQEFKLARTILEEAFNLDKDRSDFYNFSGCLHYVNHEYLDSKNSFKKAIQIDLLNGGAYFNMGLLYKKLGDNEQACDHYNVAIYLEESLKNHTHLIINVKINLK